MDDSEHPQILGIRSILWAISGRDILYQEWPACELIGIEKFFDSQCSQPDNSFTDDMRFNDTIEPVNRLIQTDGCDPSPLAPGMFYKAKCSSANTIEVSAFGDDKCSANTANPGGSAPFTISDDNCY